MDKINSLNERLKCSTSPIITECLATMTEQGEKNLFYKQVLVLERSRRNDEPYTEYRSRVLQTYLEEELNRVKPTTFYFYPLGSVEPRTYMQLDYDKQAVFNKFIFMNAGLGNRAPSECGVRLKECIACRIMYNKYCKLDELHLLLQCPRYNHTRETLGISDLIRQLNQSYDSPQIAYVKYWGKNTIVSKEELTWRTDCASMMKEVYLKDVVYLKLQIRRYG